MPTPHSPSTILIVEDDEVLGQVLARVLSCEGRIARHVSTAGEALQQVRGGIPQLVLVDVELRDGTGLKLADAIRTSGARLPVILLMTHHLEKSDRPGRGEKLVTKSIDLPELRRTIETALREFLGTDGPCDLSPGTRDFTGVAAHEAPKIGTLRSAP